MYAPLAPETEDIEVHTLAIVTEMKRSYVHAIMMFALHLDLTGFLPYQYLDGRLG